MLRSRMIGSAVLAMVLLVDAAVFAQDYRILLTNDDGIDSPLLVILKTELQSLGGVEVVVAAPRENQSGSSNSSIGSPLVVDRVLIDGAFFGYAVHGRPADAVTFGLTRLGMDRPFDLVVSGINNGANVGKVSHGSGTVGAAMRAQYLGVASIAVSQAGAGVDTRATARFTARVVEKYRRDGPLQDVVLSINVPAGELRGTQVRPMGESYLGRSPYRVVGESENSTTFESNYTFQQAIDPESDTYSYQSGYITITPLKFDWTAYEVLDELSDWDIR